MRAVSLAMLVTVLVVASCRDRGEEPETAPPAADTTAAGTTAGQAPGGGAAGAETAETTIGGEGATTASSVEETGAPQPPGGYAVESRPGGEGQLASIEYASPRTVREAAEFYDTQIQAARRVELDVAGDNVVVYGLSPNTSITAATTIQDVERMLRDRTEPMLVISPWTMGRNDELVRALRDIGQGTQADALLETRSKVTVVYAVR